MILSGKKHCLFNTHHDPRISQLLHLQDWIRVSILICSFSESLYSTSPLSFGEKKNQLVKGEDYKEDHWS